MIEDNQDVTFQKLIDKYLKDDTRFFIKAFKNTCRNKSLSDDKLKVLKDELGKDIVVQVEKADRRKPILLIGSNDALVKGTLALIWNTHPLIPKGKTLIGSGNDRVYFVDKNYSGMTEDEIRKDLFDKNELSDEESEDAFLDYEFIELIKPLIKAYKRGVMPSLRGLEDKQHKNILKRLGVIKESHGRDLINGVLVVGIDSTDHLPRQLVKKFESIRLESGKKVAKDKEIVFTYDEQKGCVSRNGISMRLSKKRKKLLIYLKTPKNIRAVLKKFYKETISKGEKVIDNKSSAYYKFTSDFNNKWRKTFKLNGELIACKNEICAIAQKIKYQHLPDTLLKIGKVS